MTSVSKCGLESSVNLSSLTTCWDDLPTELLLYIFKKLDIKSIRCCLSVNRKWKDVAISLCESQDLWQQLAEDGIVNHGVTHRFKSTLGWKDLYYNSLLWNYIQSASLNKIHEIEKVDIKNMHIYRDKLIVITKNSIDYYNAETFESIRVFSIPCCEDLQETDDILILVTKNNDYYKVTVFLKLDKDEQVDILKYVNLLCREYTDADFEDTHTFIDAWRWRIVGNCGYIIDKRSVLWECSCLNKSLNIESLARFYGDFKLTTDTHSLNTIHVIKEDVYIAVKWGDLVLVSRKNMMVRKVNVAQIPTKIIEGRNLDKHPPYREGADKFDAFVNVPYAIGFSEGLVAPRNMLHFHYDDPEMTSGLQHGDVVLRGFQDGRVEITLLRDDSKLEFNVKELDSDQLEDPAVIGLEVSELMNMHKLFIATGAKLYSLLIVYPEELLA